MNLLILPFADASGQSQKKTQNELFVYNLFVSLTKLEMSSNSMFKLNLVH